MSETDHDPESPPANALPLVPTPEGLNALAAAGLAAAREGEEDLDASTAADVDPDVIDPTSEDLQDINEVDDTEDRDYYPVKDD